MKIRITVIVVALLLMTGCSSDLGTGAAGAGIGALFQNTLTGAKHDLNAREEALIEAYNEGVEMGMKEEDLAGIKKELALVRSGRKGIEVGEQFLGLDWNNPKQTSMAFGSLIELGLLVWGGNKLRKTAKELKGTKAGINKFCGVSDPKIAGELHDTVKAKVNTA